MQESKPRTRSLPLTIAVLGVVYGDIGTSPLYAIRECFHGRHAIAVTSAHILGVLSLVFWSLIVVISVKYITVVMRADNDGEGGILALMALVVDPDDPEKRRRAGRWMLLMMGLFGAALLYGDGMITPAISVLSAVEGLQVATPVFAKFVVPITALILFGLFRLQSRGSATVGNMFGPITLVWMVVIAAWGLHSIVQSPGVLRALNPAYAVHFFAEKGLHSLITLGVVFLVVTGGEALYADMGHFGATPIRRAWVSIVLPALVLNYFGQGAFLLREPANTVNPFYHMLPGWALYPMVALATAATIIASQAVITGAFSLTWQGIQLGYLPHLRVLHTSEEEIGQVFIPAVNNLLLVATIALVFGFRTSSALASAYGVAVTTTMVITTVLLFVAMQKLWKWPVLPALLVAMAFLTVDLAFFGANIIKVWDGGWFPLAVGTFVMIVMTTWRTGRRILYERVHERVEGFQDKWAKRREMAKVVPGTAVFLTREQGSIPPTLIRILRYVGVIYERIVIVTIVTERVPVVRWKDRIKVIEIDPSMYRVIAHYGFNELPHVPHMLRQCSNLGLDLDPSNVIYVVGRETLRATPRKGMAIWRERLFTFLARNSGRASDLFRIPADKVLEIGAEIEL